MTRNQAIRCRIERTSGEYNVADLRDRISRFKQAAEGIRGLVVEDKMRNHPVVNEKLCEAAVAINEAFGRDESGHGEKRITFNMKFDDGKVFRISTSTYVQEQGWSDIPAVSFGLFEPVNEPRVTNVEVSHAVSLRNPGYGNALDMKPQAVLDKLVEVVGQLEKRLQK